MEKKKIPTQKPKKMVARWIVERGSGWARLASRDAVGSDLVK